MNWGSQRNAVLEDKENLSLGDVSNVIGNLTLPREGANGSSIAWETADPSVVSETGEVTVTEEARSTVLTATLTLGDASAVKEFQVTVAARAQLEELILNRVQVPYAVTGSLPTEFEGGITVAWEDPAGLVQADGTLNQPETSTETQVTAQHYIRRLFL